MSLEVWNLIKAVELESGRNNKIDRMRDLLAHPLGKLVVSLTYDASLTWGISVRPPELENGPNDFVQDEILPILVQLAKRELTGNAATHKVQYLFDSLNIPGREILYRILSKDLKVGVGLSTLAKIEPGLVPTFSVQRAQKYETRHVKKWPVKVEFKLDGQRNTFVCRNGQGAFYTRSGKHVKALDFFVSTVIRVAQIMSVDCSSELKETIFRDGVLDFVLDGEAMMGLFEETGVFRSDRSAVGSELHLYDIMHLHDFVDPEPAGSKLTDRRKILTEFVRRAKAILASDDNAEMIQIVPQFYANSETEVLEIYERAINFPLATYLARRNKVREAELMKTCIDKQTGRPKTLEGVIVKDPDALYEKRKTRAWMKIKPEETEDLRVIGAYHGDYGTKYKDMLGGLIVDRKGVEVRVGGGFSDLERKELWERFENDLKSGAEDDFQSASRGLGDVLTFNDVFDISEILERYDLMGRLIEVKFFEVTPDGSLRHPNFVRFREDKQGEI